MNTKTFAQQSRNLLMDGVAKKLLYWGFNPTGEVLETPEEISGGYSFRGEVFDDPDVPHLWDALKKAVEKKGIEVVVEEAAYTWFNRLMALRIMAKNGYEPSLLENAEGLEHTPVLLQKARQGQVQFLNAKEQERLQKIIGDYSKDQEAFSLLLVGYCHSHNTLNKVFGKLDDYTELLLPDNMLQDQGFLHLLNTTDAISDEEYQQVELIGWLYQFYISERKDEVFKAFKKKKKAEAKDIPAATQIFTPNWIVKYMVENTAGKLWLDLKPNSPLKDQMKYLVKNDGHPEPVEGALSPRAQSRGLISNVEELTLIDPACGSGHILVEGFELLYQMYLEEYYTPEEAVQTIFEKNLYGLDIDERAAQLATFAVMLKAAKVYPDVWDKDWQLNIYAMPEANSFSQQDVVDFLGEEGKDYIEALDKALKLMQQAKNLGSVMQLDLSEETVEFIAQRYQVIKQKDFLDFNLTALLPKLDAYIPVLLTLSQKFTAVVANPPYMGQKNMNAQLKNYVGKTYPISKSDLFAVFMESTLAMTVKEGLMGMINQHSWMFLSSYENLRAHILGNYGIVNMLHLGPRTFEELSGERVQSTAFILNNCEEIEFGEYFSLVSFKSSEKKHLAFLSRKNLYSKVSKKKFYRLPKVRIGYWLSETLTNVFEKSQDISSMAYSDGKNVTGNVAKYIRYHWEVSSVNLGMDIRWFKISKGGVSRKYYGNVIEVIDWSEEARLHYRKAKAGRIIKEKLWELPGITWSKMKSKNVSFRFLPSDTTFDEVNITFIDESKITSYLALLNSKILNNLIEFLNPTTSLQIENILEIPIPIGIDQGILETISSEQINISKTDWDSHETSWDFEQSPLLLSDQGLGIRDENSPLSTRPSSLSEAYERWEKDVTQDFFQLHQNEEELNRIFIDIYGLQDELTPEVALKDITILQEELNRKQLEKDEVGLRDEGIGIRAKNEGLSLVPKNYSLPIDKAEVMQQFISYAIGLFMGRYRLDKPGLSIAHPDPSQAELEEYIVISGKGLGPKAQQDILNYISNEHPEFSRSIGLAEINASSNPSLSNKQSVSERGNVWANESNSQSSCIRSEQYSGRTSKRNKGISSLSEDSQRLTGRDGNAVRNSQSSGVSGQQNTKSDPETNNRNQQNAEWLAKEANKLIANPSSLVPIKIDEDAILPVMGTKCNFPDDVLQQFNQFLDTIWGGDTRTENLNFIQDCLDKDLEKFLIKDFYKYHCGIYKKKPIYWLFASPKGAFQVLVYMHRMNAFTVEKIRANYLLEHLKNLRSQESMLLSNESNLSTQETKRLDQIRKDINECETYDSELKEVADQQIEFDLDDGVSVNYKKFEPVLAKIK